ncbi:hypothetical protein ABIC28_004995 [Rhodococcus sp. PvR044]
MRSQISVTIGISEKPPDTPGGSAHRSEPEMTDLCMILQRADDTADLFADRDFLEAVARAANLRQAHILAELLTTTGHEEDADRFLSAHAESCLADLPDAA